MITEQIKEQIEIIRMSGECNMLDIASVQYVANQNRFFDLVVLIANNKRAYQQYIMRR